MCALPVTKPSHHHLRCRHQHQRGLYDHQWCQWQWLDQQLSSWRELEWFWPMDRWRGTSGLNARSTGNTEGERMMHWRVMYRMSTRGSNGDDSLVAWTSQWCHRSNWLADCWHHTRELPRSASCHLCWRWSQKSGWQVNRSSCHPPERQCRFLSNLLPYEDQQKHSRRGSCKDKIWFLHGDWKECFCSLLRVGDMCPVLSEWHYHWDSPKPSMLQIPIRIVISNVRQGQSELDTLNFRYVQMSGGNVVVDTSKDLIFWSIRNVVFLEERTQIAKHEYHGDKTSVQKAIDG